MIKKIYNAVSFPFKTIRLGYKFWKEVPEKPNFLKCLIVAVMMNLYKPKPEHYGELGIGSGRITNENH